MEIRRRASLPGLVAVVSALIAAGYLWRFGSTGSGVDLLIAVLLVLLATVHACAWRGARSPMFIADRTGLRIRLGGGWAGVPWTDVERVEVDERGRVSDGHVAVIVADDKRAIDESGWRSRLAATSNRWLYDAALVVPFGLTTRVSVADLAAELTSLADGRAEIVLAGDAHEPAPTVEITSPMSRTEPEAAHLPKPELGPEPELEPDAPPEFEVVARDQRRQVASVAKVVAALRARPARRAEVTMPVRQQSATASGSTLPAAPRPGSAVPTPDQRHATIGGLALASPYPDHEVPPLPEAGQLRRREADPEEEFADTPGNVSLIIDATTDLSARAMQKVRRPLQPTALASRVGTATAGQTIAPSAGAEPGAPGPYIGRDLVEARHHLGLSVDELADRTRIRPYVIESLEADDFSPCGGDFYARGHLRMLARVLGIDAEALVTTYDDHFATSPISPREVFDVELASGTSGLIRGTDSGSKWRALIVAVLALLLVWGAARFFWTDPTRIPSGSVPPGSTAAVSSAHLPSRPVAAPGQLNVQLTAVGLPSQVVVRDRYRHVVFAGLVAQGTTKTVRGMAPLSVAAANGGSISLTVQGRRLGPMGSPGTAAHQEIMARTR